MLTGSRATARGRSIRSPSAKESAAGRPATCLENRDGEVTLEGSTPSLSALPPESAGDDAGVSFQRAGFDSRWRCQCEVAQQAERPAVTREVEGSKPSLAAKDAWAGRQGTWLQTTSHSVRLRDASLCGGRSTARTSARQVDNQGSIPCRHTMRTSFKSRTPALQAGDAGATPVVRSIEPAGAPAGAVGLYPTAARAALDTGSAGP